MRARDGLHLVAALALLCGCGEVATATPAGVDETATLHGGLSSLDAVGQAVGNVLVSYAGSGPRDGGLRNAVKINTRVDRSAPVFMSRAGFWCSAENRVLARVRPRLVP